jgi:3-isopropylmalate dehydratase small subunit
MEPFTRLTAVAAPLLRDNIDTDAIIPSREMRSVSKTGLADGLFAGWRYVGIGTRDRKFRLRLQSRTRRVGACGIRHPGDRRVVVQPDLSG